MRTQRPSFPRFTLLCAVVLIFSSRANAQTSAAQDPASTSTQRTSVAPTSAAQPRVTQAIDPKNLVVLSGNVHPLARPEYDQGPVADAQPLKRMLLLLRRSPEQDAVLLRLLDDQQDKSSPNYHAWLTPEQFGRQFGPADADMQTVTDWLASQGFTDIKAGPGRNIIEFSGNVAQVRSVFHTEMHLFFVNREEHIANVADPQIPAALAPVVSGIVSLHNFPKTSHARTLGQFRRTLGKSQIEPLFTFPNPFSGRTFYALGPGDFATIYNTKPLLTGGNDGSGQTIAIVGETNINVQDVQQFRSMFGLPANFDATNIVLNGEDPGITSVGEEGEADLDVEWSGATAPGATVKFVVSASTPASAGIDLSALYIVEHNLAGVISESYGACESALGSTENAFYNSLWEQAAAQGITVFVSSGDGGSAGCDDFHLRQPAAQGLAVSGLASTPFNISVGGTDFDDVNVWSTYWNATNDPTGTSAKSYIPEIPWNENCAQISLTGCGPTAPQGSVNIVAGGGGQSSLYGKPKWQMGVSGMPNDNHRDQPDVALFASPGFDGTGYVYCQSDATTSGVRSCDINTNSGLLDFGVIGGTSASAPAFAGIMALVNQYQSTHGGANRQGNANYTFYALYKKSGASCASSSTEAASCIFNDVKKGNSFLPTGAPGIGTNSVPCQGGSLNCSASTPGSTGVLVDPLHTSTEAWMATAGYDLATGLGTVNANNLAISWGTVSTIPTTTTLTLSPTTGITHGAENVSVSVTVKPTSGASVPVGDVVLIATFSDGTTQGLDHFALTNGAVTALKAQSLPGGTYQVSAHYAGDGTNSPSDSTPIQVTVGPESSQTFIVVPSFDSQGNLLTGNSTSVIYGSRYIIRMYVTNTSASATAAGPPSPLCFQVDDLTCPTGGVTLTANGASLDGSAFALNNAGYTRDIAPTLGGGTYALLAQYSGDSSYNSSSASDSFTVTPDPTSLGLNVWNTAVAGSPFPANVSAYAQYPGAATTSGTVTFFDGPTQLGSPVVIQGYPGTYQPALFASTSLTLATAGSHTISAQYSGDANYAASTASATINVLNPTTVTVSANPTDIPYGSSTTVTVSVNTNVKGPSMTGSILISSSMNATVSPVTTTISTDANGNTMLQGVATVNPQGSTFIYATYTGDSNFAYSTSNSAFVQVDIPDFSFSVPASLNVDAGQSASLQIGIVPASNNSSPVSLSCSGSLPSGYTCALQPSTVNLANGATSTATLTIAPLPGSTLARNKISSRPSFILPFSSRRIPPDLVLLVTTFIALFAFMCTWTGRRARVGLAFGTALLLGTLGCGGGGSSFGESGGSGGGAPPPTPTATTTTVSTSAAKVAQQAPVTFTASVTGTGTAKPSGTVAFYVSGNFYGQASLVNGTAVFTASIPYPGIFSVTAAYTGDTSNNPSSSAAISQAVTGSTLLQVYGYTGTLFHSANVTINLQ